MSRRGRIACTGRCIGAPAGALPTYACTLTNAGWYQGYDQLQGTSQAAPMVSGLAALILSIAPHMSCDGVQAVMEESAVDVGPAGWDADFGWGRIHAAAELVRATEVFADGFESGGTSGWSSAVP